MGLWLKCPQCQTANALDLKSCAQCNASLEKLPPAKRVYVLDKAAPAAPKAAAPKAASKKAPPEKAASAESPPKRAKGAKSSKKKQP